MKLIKDKKNIVILLASIFILILFAYITRLSPLAGDDWGYAVLGRVNNPFKQTLDFYFSWSGRVFSELWGFVVAPRKWLWNIINPLLFASMVFSILRLVKNKNIILITLVLLGLMLSVNNTLRIETYTWIMGSTYVVPLALFLIYINLLRPYILENNILSIKSVVGLSLLNVYISLCMENMTAILLLFNILCTIYSYFKNKQNFKYLVVFLLISIGGTLIIRLSPGATYRLNRDNSSFSDLGLFEKISTNWINFLNLTLIKNTYLILALSLTLFIASLKIKKINIYLIVFSLGVLQPLASLLYGKINLEILKIFFDVEYTKSALIFNSIFIFIYIACIFALLKKIFDEKKFYEASTYLLLAGCGNIVMLISPIFGARSSLYTVYFVIILCLYILSNIEINKYIKYCLIGLFTILIAVKVKDYLYKYRMIASVQKRRDMEIEYYVNNPEVEEAWLIRMPKDFIHSADIEEGDQYHMDVFKEYYGINKDMKLIFYKDK